jgi:hypothetical protein
MATIGTSKLRFYVIFDASFVMSSIMLSLEKGPPRRRGRQQVVQAKLQKIHINGCGGPGRPPNATNDEECPFGFHESHLLAS